ncbi:MAG: hypothetical protein AABY22_12855 [Nanoarchaeota archaeon]
MKKTKVCGICKELKSLDEFYKNSKIHDYYDTYCKKCRLDYRKKHPWTVEKWEKKNKESIAIRKKIYWNKRRYEVREKVIGHYSNNTFMCLCYGCYNDFIEFLEVDHIEGGGSAHLKKLGIKGGLSFYIWLVKNNFPSGFQVLCSNCNGSKGKYGYCPHWHKLYWTLFLANS